MPKLFTTIVPPSLKAVSEAFQFAPAVRIGDQILVSGIAGVDAEGHDCDSPAACRRRHQHDPRVAGARLGRHHQRLC